MKKSTQVVEITQTMRNHAKKTGIPIPKEKKFLIQCANGDYYLARTKKNAQAAADVLVRAEYAIKALCA